VSAEIPQRRKITAKQAAARLGASERTIRRITAEPRSDYLRRVQERGAQILTWREEGVKWKDIGERLGISTAAAQMAGRRELERRKQEGQTPGAASDVPQGAAP
jgi:DeoR/GlpR family transcriptional regulator of sugar metabolism